MTLKKLTAATLLGVFSTAASAVPFMTMDPRALGMGGTGVASGTSANASFYNPALLAAARQDEDFSLELPVIAYRISDPDDLRTAITDASEANYFENYDKARADLQTGIPTPQEIDNFRKATNDLLTGLESFSNKTVEADGSVNLVIGVPSRNTGIAVTLGGWTSFGFVGELTATDNNTLRALANADFTNPLDPNYQDPATIIAGTDYSSNIRTQGILARELGISLAHEFSLFNRDVAMGITPKAVMASTLDYIYRASDIDNAEFDLNQGRQDSTGFSMDFGMARDYGNGWKTGLSIKNLIPQSYETATGDKIEVNPTARFGLAYLSERANLALDLDLTENDPAGLGGKSQYASLGAELDVWVLLVRLGYRYNLANPDTSVVTAGLGLNLLGLHVDVGAGVGNNEVAAAAQLGFKF